MAKTQSISDSLLIRWHRTTRWVFRLGCVFPSVVEGHVEKIADDLQCAQLFWSFSNYDDRNANAICSGCRKPIELMSEWAMFSIISPNYSQVISQVDSLDNWHRMVRNLISPKWPNVHIRAALTIWNVHSKRFDVLSVILSSAWTNKLLWLL